MTSELAAFRSNLVRATPFGLAVPVLIGLAAALAVELRPVALAVGAAGWLLALVLRAPVAVVAVRAGLDEDRSQAAVAASSGPLEEGVRVVTVLLLGRDLGTAVSIGLGWAAIEVAYAIVNGFAIAALSSRDDPEAERARAMMPPVALTSAAPWWGVVERAWATVLHIAFAMIAAAQPALVVVTAIVHSAINLVFVRLLLAGTRMWRIHAAGALVAALLLAIGVYATRLGD